MVKSDNSVYVVAAARTDSVRYNTENFRSLSDLLAEPVRQIPDHILHSVDTVYITHRYPTPLGLDFDREKFLNLTNLPQGDILTILSDERAILGGMAVIKRVVGDLREGKKSTVLIVGGEVFEPSVWLHLQGRHSAMVVKDSKGSGSGDSTYRARYQLRERRHILNKFGGLPSTETEIGLTPLSANALVADALFRESGLSIDEMNELLCLLSCHLEKYAFMNPRSYQHHKKDEKSPKGMDRITSENYRTRAYRKDKWPFTLLDLCSISNGAGALVLTNDARNHRHKVLVAGCVVCKQGANKSLADRPRIAQFNANLEAWQELKETLDLDLSRPKPGTRPIMILELFDIYAFQIAMTLMEMGMYKNLHDILQDLERGYFDPAPDTTMPQNLQDISSNCGVILNPSGGSKDGHPNGGFAFVKMAECFFRLTGLHTDSIFTIPPEDLDLALVHTLSGVGNTAGIVALKRE